MAITETVIEVIDGDTFMTDNHSVRLADVNAPELGTPGADVAKSRLEQLILYIRSGGLQLWMGCCKCYDRWQGYGCDIMQEYVDIALVRLEQLNLGLLKMRPMGMPIYFPGLPAAGYRLQIDLDSLQHENLQTGNL